MPIIRRGMSSSATTATIVAAAVDQEVEITPPGTPEEADAAVAEAQEALDAATESGDADAIDDAQADLDVAVANQTAANDMVDSITGEDPTTGRCDRFMENLVHRYICYTIVITVESKIYDCLI